MLIETRTTRIVALALIALGVIARLIPHIPNLTPATALALFGAATLPAAWGVAVPLAMVVLSDLVIGLYDTVGFTWAAFALTALFGWWIRRHPSALRIVSASVLGSLVFFAVSNFGVWAWGGHGAMYPKTLAGLRDCFIAALPFLRVSVLGDVVFTVGIFGLYALITHARLTTARLPAKG